MRCRYINLDAADARRAALEASWRAANPPQGWELVRFPAITGDAAAEPGKISASEKGCFASHRELLRASLGDDRPLLVLEDDVRFAPLLAAALPEILGGLKDWDLLFTDVAVGDAGAMMWFARDRVAFSRDGHIRVLNLARTHFSAASAYVVNGASKAKLLQALDGLPALDAPYDTVLRAFAAAGHLKAFVTVPFLTTVTDAPSQIADRPHDAAVTLFRRTLFADRDDDACEREALAVEADLSSLDARLAGAAFAGFLDAVSREP